MLAFGWSIKQNSVVIEELDITVPIFIFVIVIHGLIAGLTFLDDNEHYKYHDHSGV